MSRAPDSVFAIAWASAWLVAMLCVAIWTHLTTPREYRPRLRRTLFLMAQGALGAVVLLGTAGAAFWLVYRIWGYA